MNSEYKRCPRCGQKAPLNATMCLECGLKFDRIKNLSNKEAKRAIKNKEKDKVLYVTQMPKDVITKKFYLLYILLGIFGAYNIYIGKYKRGYYTLITVSASLLMFILNEIFIYSGLDTSTFEYIIVNPFFTFASFGIIIWFLDLISLITHTFKYPACITSDDYIKYMLNSKSLSNYSNLKDINKKSSK